MAGEPPQKKLIAAGWHWASQSPADDAIAEYKAMGIVMPPELLAHLKTKEHTVWHDNWPALELFAACATQWRAGPAGGVTGLDYTAVRSVMQMSAVLDQHQMFDDIRLLELGALTAFRKQPLDDLIDGRT